jgi:AAA ATPase domain
MGLHTRSEPTPALLGRQRELEALEGLIEDVRSGRGWALAVRGEAGVGKTALLDYVVDGSGLRVVPTGWRRSTRYSHTWRCTTASTPRRSSECSQSRTNGPSATSSPTSPSPRSTPSSPPAIRPAGPAGATTPCSRSRIGSRRRPGRRESLDHGGLLGGTMSEVDTSRRAITEGSCLA